MTRGWVRGKNLHTMGFAGHAEEEYLSIYLVLIRLLQQAPMYWGQDLERSATPRVWLQQPDKQNLSRRPIYSLIPRLIDPLLPSWPCSSSSFPLFASVGILRRALRKSQQKRTKGTKNRKTGALASLKNSVVSRHESPGAGLAKAETAQRNSLGKQSQPEKASHPRKRVLRSRQ